MANETTTKFKVDISDLKKNIQEANRQIRLANAEFKAASAGMQNWSKSADGLSAKISQSEKVLKAQKSILSDYEKQLVLIEVQYGKGSKEADEMRIKIENQRAAVAKTEKSISDYQAKLAALESEQRKTETATSKLTDTIDKQQKELDELKDRYKSVVLEQGKSSAEAKELAKQIDDLSGELKTNQEKLKAANDAADDLDNTLDDLGETTEETSGGFTILKGAIADLVAKGIEKAIGAIKDFAKASIEAGQNFEKSMSNVQALSGATGDELEMLKETAKEYGSTTQFSATEAADALGYMALAGWDANQSAEALGGVLNLAASSGMELAAASDMVTDYMSAFSLSADKSAYFADLLAYAQSHANTTAQGLGEAFKNCAANMNAAGQDVETTTALLSMLANQGLKGSQAGTALAAVMRDLSKNMESTGYSTKSFTQTAANLSLGLKGDLSKAFSKIGVSSEDFTEALKLSGGHVDSLLKNLQGFADEGEDVNKVFSELGLSQNDLGKIMTSITANMRNFKITVGETEVAVTDMDGNFRDMTDILLEVEKATEGMGEAEKSMALSSTFTADSIKGLNMILNSGVQSAADFEEELRKSTGSAEDMAKVMNDNLAGDMTALGSKIEGVQIALYERLEPALRKGAEYVSQFVDAVAEKLPEIVDKFEDLASKAVPVIKSIFGWFVDNKDVIIAAIVGIGSAMVAWNVATVVTNIVKLVKAIKTMGAASAFAAAKQWILNTAMMANPIGAIVTAIAALVGAFIYLWNTSEDFRNFWIGLWDSIQEVAGKVVEAVADFFVGLWDGIKSAWSAVTGFFSGIWESIQESASNLVEKVAGFFKSVADFIKKVFEPVVNFYKSAFNIIKELATGCWNAIKKVWEIVSKWFDDNVIKPVSAFFSGLWDGVKNAASTAWNAVKTVWAVVSGWFKEKIISPISNFFSGMWDGLKNGAKAAWEGIKSVFGTIADWFKDKFSKAWQAVKDVFSTGGKVFDGIKDGIVSAFKTVVNAIIRGINKVIAIPFNAINGVLEKIQGVSIAGYKPFENLISRLPVPEIPELERGGVLKRGQVGLLEGNGAEAVVPLENNAKWIRATANDLRKALVSEGIIGSSGGSQSITNNYSFNQTNNSPKALSRLEIYRQTKNLFAMQGV